MKKLIPILLVAIIAAIAAPAQAQSVAQQTYWDDAAQKASTATQPTDDWTSTLNAVAAADITGGIDAIIDYLENGLLIDGTLAVSGTAEDFKTTSTAVYRLSGTCYTKAATDTLSFTAADTINTAADTGDFSGVWLVQINAAGTVSTKSPSADQVYASAELAIAALPAVTTANVALGYIVVTANTDTAWTANTDDMTAASDCAAIVYADTTVKTVPSNL